jgi:hypothetical protein
MRARAALSAGNDTCFSAFRGAVLGPQLSRGRCGLVSGRVRRFRKKEIRALAPAPEMISRGRGGHFRLLVSLPVSPAVCRARRRARAASWLRKTVRRGDWDFRLGEIRLGPIFALQ